MPENIRVEYLEPRVVSLVFDLTGKSVNSLSQNILCELDKKLTELSSNNSVNLLLIESSKKSGFVVGADLSEVAQGIHWPKSDKVQFCKLGIQVFRKLSALPFPTIALIDGNCLGGGAELAAWCDFRITTDSPQTKIGLPELKLGLVPGWGGTVRFLQLIGSNATRKVLCNNLLLDSDLALRLGWSDRVAPIEDIHQAAIRFAQSVSSSTLQELRNSRLTFATSETPSPNITSTNSDSNQNPEIPNSLISQVNRLLDVHSNASLDSALDAETELMTSLWGSQLNSGMMQSFFVQEELRRQVRQISKANSALPNSKIGVVGGGIVGREVARRCSSFGLEVTLLEASPSTREQLQADFELHRTSQLRPIKVSDSIRDLSDSDFIIESITEDLPAKQNLLKEIEGVVSSQCVITSNTSTLRITDIAANLANSERLIGFHFLMPVDSSLLCEIVPQSPDQPQRNLVASLATQIGLLPIFVDDQPGFLVNRLLSRYFHAATELLLKGHTVEEIDQIATENLMEFGPFQFMDLIGLQTAFRAGFRLWSGKSSFQPNPILPAMIKRKGLGTQSGKGFYDYTSSPSRLNPTTNEVISIYKSPKTQNSPNKHDILMTLRDSLWLSAAEILAEDSSQGFNIEVAALLGLRIRREMGGLLAMFSQLDSFKPRAHPFSSLSEKTLQTLRESAGDLDLVARIAKKAL